MENQVLVGGVSIPGGIVSEVPIDIDVDSSRRRDSDFGATVDSKSSCEPASRHTVTGWDLRQSLRFKSVGFAIQLIASQIQQRIGNEECVAIVG